MTKRIGYGRQNETPVQAKQHPERQQRNPRVRNLLGNQHITWFRDQGGNYFKVVISGGSFAWVKVDPAEFEAANEASIQQ